MAYTKTVWKDRIVEFARRFTKTGETANSVTLTADPGAIAEAGTPVNAANMNKLEQGVFDAAAVADAAMPRAGGTFSGNVNAKLGLDFTRSTNFGKASDPPGYYPVGESIFFANGDVGPHGFPKPYGTVVTIKAYPAAPCTQYFYPYLTDDPVLYRNGLFNNTWSEWRNIWDTNMLREKATGTGLEYYDGVRWVDVGASYPDWLAQLDIFNDGINGVFNPSSNMVLPSGIYRYSSLNIPAGVTITPNGSFLVLLVNGVANVDGTISASGKGALGAAATGSPGVGGVGGVAGGGGGGGGTTTSSSSEGTAASAGGHGGDATLLPGGGVSNYTAPNGFPGASSSASIVHKLNGLGLFQDLKGGGGGRGKGYPYPASAGGAGGGAIILIAKSITGSGAIRADGIAGSDGQSAVPNNYGSGGGGGGGGGLAVAVAYGVIALTVTANGGAGGSGGANAGAPGNGGNGGSGGNGFALKIQR